MCEVKMGSINLRRIRQNRWAGDTIGDTIKLQACGCPAYFGDRDYDNVLVLVSLWGFDLATPIEIA